MIQSTVSIEHITNIREKDKNSIFERHLKSQYYGSTQLDTGLTKMEKIRSCSKIHGELQVLLQSKEE